MRSLVNIFNLTPRTSISSSINLTRRLLPESASRYHELTTGRLVFSSITSFHHLASFRMPPRKRNHSDVQDCAADTSLRRSSRRVSTKIDETSTAEPAESAPVSKRAKTGAEAPPVKEKPVKKAPVKKAAKPSAAVASGKDGKEMAASSRAMSPDPPISSIPRTNPDAPRHDGEWYWLMKAEPETRMENGVDVRFSIDDLRSKTEPEGWDGIRAYAARNHMRNMNAGDKAFFYHSNCKEPGIAGIMEIVKEFSDDRTARRAGPYHDPSATKENPRWSLVHVEFRKKFAVPIGLKELRELGAAGGPLAEMQMLKQGRLSVSRVQKSEWEALCALADKKAKDAGLKHEE
ncbi:Putative AT DNA binding protein [[Torrubiella] hemipterigena]|uniref:Thymocyte nuclear protein 1 n=1 Tax=[Torrubiella] hemipterigena TaxID=1531966 RepID=A0A0A1TS96_9HYPO|nr:Putative AT DNA binding protein [[Torrubiella] hemipterigena]